MLRKLLLIGVVLLFSSTVTYAQTGTLTGVVTDQQSGEPVPAANIYIQSIERGVSTNVDGEYTISDISTGTYTVRVSYIGYTTIEESVSVETGENVVNFELQPDLVGLDEVIVTGQGGAGVQSKRLSTTVDVISPQDLETAPSQNLGDILQANLPTSQIRTSSGQPGTAALIRGRGVNSAFTATTPVIYIDGVRVDNTTGPNLGIDTGGALSSMISSIPTENIERIEVIKGGAATTLYGSDAANGVIQIFTKDGVEGSTRFNFESKVGAVVPTKDFLRYDETADLIFRTGVRQEYNLSASGGTEDVTYSFSGMMSDNDGFRAKDVNNQVRHSLRATVEAQINDVVTYRGSLGFLSHEFSRDNNANSSYGLFGSLESAGYGPLDELDESQYNALQTQVNNIASNLDLTEDTKRFQTSHKLSFDITEGLGADINVGVESVSNRQRWVATNAYLIALDAVSPGTTDQGSIELFERDFLGITVDGSFQYEKDFGDFSSISVFGGQFFRTDDRQLNLFATEVPDGITTLNSAGDVSTEDYRSTVAQYGLFFNENLGYKDRYFIEFGLRGDGNTAFGEETGIQYYPRVGVSYSLSSEPFFQDMVSSDIISNLKLRANYGKAGNFPPPFSNVILSDIDPFRDGQSLEFGTRGDVNLRPEKSTTMEVGGDIAFLNDRIIAELTYYESTTEDALFNTRFASSSGYTEALRNVGKIENKGLELSTSFIALQQRDYYLRLKASFNTLENEVVESGGAPFNVGGFTFLGGYVEEGYPVGYFRGNKAVFSEDGSSIEEVIPSTNLGSPIPDYYGSLGFNFSYKDLSLTVNADYQLGADAINLTETLAYLSGDPDPSYYPEGVSDAGSFFDLANVWVKSGDYLKVRLISLDYTLPQDFYSGIVREIRLGASVSNPINIVRSNFDPEVTGAGIGDQGGGTAVGVGGFSYGTASPPRTFLGSVRILF